MVRIRVDPAELRVAAREIEEARRGYLGLAERSVRVGLEAPSYDGQFGPQVRAIGLEGSARLRSLADRLAEQAQELLRIADNFESVDQQAQQGLASWREQMIGLQQAGLRFMDGLGLPWGSDGAGPGDDWPPDWARWIPGLWFFWWLYLQLNGQEGALVAAPSPTATAEATLVATPTMTPTLEPTGTAEPRSYGVQPGDTLWGIAANHGLSVEQLMGANGLASDLIYPGQVLILPDPSYVAESGVGQMPVPETGAEGSVPAVDFGSVRFERGFNSQINDPNSNAHNGIDVSGVGVIPIQSSFNGQIAFYWDGGFDNGDVSDTLEDNYGWGNSMIVEYPYADQSEGVQMIFRDQYGAGEDDSVYLMYGHLGTGFEADLPPDLQVQPGTVLARMGDTGYTTGPHLHLSAKVGPSGDVGARESEPGSGLWEVSGGWYQWQFVDPAGLGIVPTQ